MEKKILIAADSAFKRQTLSGIISPYQSFVVVNISRNGVEAMKMIENYDPDILILDLPIIIFEVLTGFKRLMKYSPTPTIFILDEDLKDSKMIETRIKDIGFKHYDYVVKRKGNIKEVYAEIEEYLITKIFNLLSLKEESNSKKKPKLKTTVITSDEVKKKQEQVVLVQSPIPISKLETNAVVMGASVGGPKTLKAILKDIPQSFPSPI